MHNLWCLWSKQYSICSAYTIPSLWYSFTHLKWNQWLQRSHSIMLESYETGSWHSQWMCTNRCFLVFLVTVPEVCGNAESCLHSKHSIRYWRMSFWLNVSPRKSSLTAWVVGCCYAKDTAFRQHISCSTGSQRSCCEVERCKSKC